MQYANDLCHHHDNGIRGKYHNNSGAVKLPVIPYLFQGIPQFRVSISIERIQIFPKASTEKDRVLKKREFFLSPSTGNSN